MTRLFLAIAAVATCWSPNSVAQNNWNQSLARHVANDLLMRLTNPKETEYRVGVINAAAEFGVLVSPKGQPAVAESIRGYSSARSSGWQLSWTATELLDSSADDLVFEVMRKRVTVSSCPEMDVAVREFYAELERTMQAEILLSEIPQKRRPETFTVDGTWYVVQIWTGERTIAIYPDRDIDVALDEASRVLASTIGRCSSELPGTVEEHYGW